MAAVATVVAGAVDLLFALPARAAGAALRRDPLTWERASASTWTARGPEARRPWARGERPVGRPRVRTIGARLAVVLLVLAGSDLVLGAVTARTIGRWEVGGGTTSYGLGPPAPIGPPATVPGYADERATSPAFADSPWAVDYFWELRTTAFDQAPYVGPTPHDRSGRYLNIRDQVRVSYGDDDAAGPVVWFFGGSTVFGEGQRDDHTIPSEVARLAEADGHPIRAVNFGVQADSDYQSMLRLEQALALRRPLPDLVVFYDGANEVTQHLSQPSTDAPQYYQGIGGPSSPPEEASVFETWCRAGTTLRAVGLCDRTEADALPAAPAVLVDQITGVYARGLGLARDLAEGAGARFASFFQPAAYYQQVPFIDDVRARLPAGTIDVSDALDGAAGQATYFDPVHTNEEGAKIVAAALYGHLRSTVADLDR